MTDNETVQGEVTDEAIQSFIDNGGQVPTFHPILKIWQSVLSNAREERNVRIGPAWANRMVSSYPQLAYQDMPTYRKIYFDIVIELLGILDEEIETDGDCLTYTSAEEDVEHNSKHYKNLLRDWQIRLTEIELNWDCLSEDAAAEIAALSEVHKMFFGETGITQYLDNIRFEYTEADQAELREVLESMRVGQ